MESPDRIEDIAQDDMAQTPGLQVSNGAIEL